MPRDLADPEIGGGGELHASHVHAATLPSVFFLKHQTNGEDKASNGSDEVLLKTVYDPLVVDLLTVCLRCQGSPSRSSCCGDVRASIPRAWANIQGFSSV
jgi:hypothetical protein